jgi:hydroxymethylpyrimidine/phosphomethylpyrimidine kinase
MPPAIALTIGGSDSGGGAGIQADLKTFLALQVHGCSAITCVTAQNTCGVTRVDALPPASVVAQVEAVCGDLAVAAVKTGMLLNRGLIEATAAALEPLALPKLIDPVMVSRAGSPLLEADAIEAYRQLLLPQAELITPTCMRLGSWAVAMGSTTPLRWSAPPPCCSSWGLRRC